mmetsp:Transcript_49049/g.140995  ORF Transcript_49049/g.140995 Transcript_49049/m.140995 type:complete len:625 (+) Transcript_49049:239-2113(+)
MELEEVLYAPFTTPTTCYSSSPCAAINRNISCRFATENHVLGLSPASKTPATHGNVPRDNSSVICVGYAQYPSGNKSGSEPVQALALVDPVLIEQPEDQPPALPYSTSMNAPENAARDDISVVSTSQSTIQDSGSRPNSRRPSVNSTSAVTSQLDASLRSMAQDEEPEIPVMTKASIQTPKARLILQIPTEEISPTPDHIAFLDFRPLSPCIVNWGEDSFAVFVGSADDCLVRMYEPLQGLLILRDGLPEEHFGIDTPVMGIDFYTDEESNTIGLVGQDGTIRLVTWKRGGRDFKDVESHTVIVDGPLVSLQFQPRKNGDLRVVIGSLCGYVCHLKRQGSEWGGPKMVVQNLWNDILQDEDSVLAVHAFGDCIAVGTLSGRLLVYQALIFGEDYHILWECNLPYPIHGIDAIILEEEDFELLVVTRRSIHVFRPKNKFFRAELKKSRYDPNAAKERLQAILSRIHEAPQEKPAKDENGTDPIEVDRDAAQVSATIKERGTPDDEAIGEEDRSVPTANATKGASEVASEETEPENSGRVTLLTSSKIQAGTIDETDEAPSQDDTRSGETMEDNAAAESDEVVETAIEDRKEDEADNDGDDEQWVLIDQADGVEIDDSGKQRKIDE